MSFALLFIFILSSLDVSSTASCPCSDKKLCERITKSPDKEVLVWTTSSLVWRHYDWSVVTTIAYFPDIWNNELMCFAHSKGVKVVMKAIYNVIDLSNEEKKRGWITNLTRNATNNHADGVNIDIEGPVKKNSKHVSLLTDLTRELSESFKKNLPGSQVTFDVAWSPDCIDGRCYDVIAISKVVDFLAIMAYDEMSQMFGPECTAKPNSPFNKTKSGVSKYLALGIKPDKLVLGQPWYGYSYPCEYTTGIDTCHIKRVPFMGANCSDAAGTQIAYSSVKDLLLTRSDSGRKWDEASQTPYINYYNMFGKLYQLWYDDSDSLRIKLEYAKGINMRGVAVWNADLLDYSPLKRAVAETKTMWETLKIIKDDKRTINKATRS